jgi:GNAT superfamily N-acetyltransferase
MTDEVTVRRGGPDDWSALKVIRLEALRDTPEAFGSTFANASISPDKRWRLAASEWNYYLAERDGQVVGMASGGFNDDRPDTKWLYGMYVSPEARGSAAAVRLVEAVSQWALDQHSTQLFLHVTTSVERARAFYVKMGFRPTGDTITMDRDPTISLVTMVRDLA